MKKDIISFLNSEKLMALSTSSRNPWSCIVYYVADSNINLYFVSSPKSQHCRDIAKNSKVSCAIYNSDQGVSDKKKGVQLRGNASEVTGLDKIKWFFRMWAKINPGNKDVINFKNFKDKVISSRIYRVTPKKIKLFDEKLYGEESFKILKL